MNSSPGFRSFLAVLLLISALCNAQFTATSPPQNISGSFGLQLNSYPQQQQSQQAQAQYAYPYSAYTQASAGQGGYYDQRSPAQTDHYGYPSPEQLAQIPAPPLRQQQVTSPYYSSAADWRGQQQPADAWRTTALQAQQFRPPQYPSGSSTPNAEQSISSNNNLPYSQQAAAATSQQSYEQFANRGQYGGGGYYGQVRQQLGHFSPYEGDYLGQQSGGNVGLQQILPRGQQMANQQRAYNGQSPLNPQYQSASSRIAFPGNNRQQDEQARHSFWFNSAAHLQTGAIFGLAGTIWLLIGVLPLHLP